MIEEKSKLKETRKFVGHETTWKERRTKELIIGHQAEDTEEQGLKVKMG